MVDVARSLWLRDAMPLPVGLALWEHYVCAVLANLGEQKAQLVHYDALTNQPGEALRWLAELSMRLARTTLSVEPRRRVIGCFV